MSTTTETGATVRPFGVEADHPRNGDLIIQGVVGCRLRSRVKHTLEVLKSKKEPRQTVRTAQAQLIPGTPEVPGMELHVKPQDGSYVIIDPLHGNDELCVELSAALSQAGLLSSHARVTGSPPQKGKLDPDRMKTLCRELRQLLDERYVRQAKGTVPTMEQIDAMPGFYLQNPGATEKNSQPRYEHEMAEWERNLNRFGG